MPEPFPLPASDVGQAMRLPERRRTDEAGALLPDGGQEHAGYHHRGRADQQHRHRERRYTDRYLEGYGTNSVSILMEIKALSALLPLVLRRS